MTSRGRAALALAAGCWLSCRRGGPAPTADRSDGQLPSMEAPRVGSITIDGRLDEPAWQSAGRTGDLVDPGTGRPVPTSRVNGEARVAWDASNLYLAWTVRDASPVAPFPPDAVDPHLWERSSAVELMLQPGDPGDNTAYYELQVDTAGAVWDTRFDDYMQPLTAGPDGGRRFGHQEWSSAVKKGIAVAAGGYTIEMALPWSALPSARTAVPPHEGDVWRMNLYTFRDGQRDALAWSPLLGQGNFHRSSRFGRVRFAAPR